MDSMDTRTAALLRALEIVNTPERRAARARDYERRLEEFARRLLVWDGVSEELPTLPRGTPPRAAG